MKGGNLYNNGNTKDMLGKVYLRLNDRSDGVKKQWNYGSGRDTRNIKIK